MSTTNDTQSLQVTTPLGKDKLVASGFAGAEYICGRGCGCCP